MENIQLEKEMENLIKIAENHFGKNYFEMLDKLTETYVENNETINYTLTTNYEGAFYAYSK